MYWNNLVSVRSVVVWGTLVTAVTSLAVMPLQSAAHDGKGKADSVCPGFVVLANGYAVLSEASQAMNSDKGHGHSEHQMKKVASRGHDHGEHKSHDAAHHKHLMGHQHGQAIVAGKNNLCVPISSPEDTAGWQ